jgi:hypothetical protein
LPDGNTIYNVQGDTQGVVINGWVAQPRHASLNGGDAVAALLLSHVFEEALPHKSLLLQTLLSAPPMSALMLAEATYDFESPPCRAVARDAHAATVVALDGALLRAAELSCMSAAARAAVEGARRAQLLCALHGCVAEAWGGGFLFLHRIGAALCVPDLRDALNALARTIAAACHAGDDAAMTMDEGESALPMALPPLPEATCAACAQPMGAVRRLCSRCRAVCYHDVECQKQHWSVHRNGVCARAAWDCAPMPSGTSAGSEHSSPSAAGADAACVCCACASCASAACHQASKRVLFQKVAVPQVPPP